MTKKTTKAGQTRVITGLAGMNPKLGAKRLKDGRESLYLDYYHGTHKEFAADNTYKTKADRHRESLKLYLYTDPRTPEQKTHNTNALEVANRVRYEREQQLLNDTRGYRTRQTKNVDFWAFIEDVAARGTNHNAIKDTRAAARHFRNYLKQNPRYYYMADKLDPKQITNEICGGFMDYLKSICRGEGAYHVFRYFNRVIKILLHQEYITKDPTAGIKKSTRINTITKEILTTEEIQRLIKTPMPNGIHRSRHTPEIRRAFIFSLYAGLRWGDVNELRYSNIDYTNKLLKVTQSKVKNTSSAANVIIPLSDYLLRLIGTPPTQYKGVEGLRVFMLPTITQCNYHLKEWTHAAGITKHITWHCARHSFAVNLLTHGTDIKTTSALMGHSTIQMTEKYLHIIDANKTKAINALPTFEE